MVMNSLALEKQEVVVINPSIRNGLVERFEKKASLIEPLILQAKNMLGDSQIDLDVFLETHTDDSVLKLMEALNPQIKMKGELDTEIKNTNKIFNSARDELTGKTKGELINIMKQHHVNELDEMVEQLKKLKSKMMERRESNAWDVVDGFLTLESIDNKTINHVLELNSELTVLKFIKKKAPELVNATKTWKLTKSRKEKINLAVETLTKELARLLEFQDKLPNTRLKAAVELYFESDFITAQGQLEKELLAQNELQKQVQAQLLQKNEKLVDELTLVKKENENIKAAKVSQVDSAFSLNVFSLHETELKQLREDSQLVKLTDTKLNLLYMIINDVASQPKTSRYLDASNFDRSELVNRLNRLLQI